jgi:hypothetical protein
VTHSSLSDTSKDSEFPIQEQNSENRRIGKRPSANDRPVQIWNTKQDVREKQGQMARVTYPFAVN